MCEPVRSHQRLRLFREDVHLNRLPAFNSIHRAQMNSIPDPWSARTRLEFPEHRPLDLARQSSGIMAGYWRISRDVNPLKS